MSTTATMPRKRADAAETQEPLTPVTIRFPESLRARAVQVARDEDRTFASLVIYALRRYVNEQEKQRDGD
jgi:predicted transcriptional regulator